MTTPIIFRPKIILLGEAGAGKTKFISRFAPNDLKKVFHKRLGVTTYTFTAQTSLGVIEYTFWDTQGQERLGILRDAYFNEANAAILFFDLTNRDSYIHIVRWHMFMKFISGDIPCILCGTKVDSKDRVIPVHKILFHRKLSYPYFEISSTTNYKIQDVLLEITRKILDTPTLSFTEDVPLKEPEQEIDQEAMKIVESNIADANQNIHVALYTNNGNQLFFMRVQTQNQDFEEDLMRELDE